MNGKNKKERWRLTEKGKKSVRNREKSRDERYKRDKGEVREKSKFLFYEALRECKMKRKK